MTKILIAFFLMFSIGCSTTKVPVADGASKTLSNDGTTSCQLIEKPFIIKNGVESDIMELYLRCSVQDYFIKICESKVTAKELRKYINSGITVKMEIKEGLLDKCQGDPELQSRIGTYVIIISIEQ